MGEPRIDEPSVLRARGAKRPQSIKLNYCAGSTIRSRSACGSAGTGAISGSWGSSAGLVVHAKTSRRTGRDAFLEIASWTGGRVIDQSRQQVRTTITQAPRRARRRRAPRGTRPRRPRRLRFADARRARAARSVPLPCPIRRGAQHRDSLRPLTELDGFVAAALIDRRTGAVIAAEYDGSDSYTRAAARAHAHFVELAGDLGQLEEIVATLGEQYHPGATVEERREPLLLRSRAPARAREPRARARPARSPRGRKKLRRLLILALTRFAQNHIVFEHTVKKTLSSCASVPLALT